MIIASNLEKSFGPQVLFESVSFLINSGERIGLVGKNGTGKSTLFNRLVGRRTAIVEKNPGVTRDRNSGIAKYHGDTIEYLPRAARKWGSIQKKSCS